MSEDPVWIAKVAYAARQFADAYEGLYPDVDEATAISEYLTALVTTVDSPPEEPKSEGTVRAKERDCARGMLDVQDETDKRIFSELYDRINELVRERDEARMAARICYRWAKGGAGAGCPAGLMSEVTIALDLEDYTRLPAWLTGGCR